MHEFEREFYRKQAEIIKNNLQDTGIVFNFFESSEEAKEYLFSNLSSDMSIGFGGSTTLVDLGIIEHLRENFPNLLDRNKKGISAAEKSEIEKRIIFADVFISGFNAITLKGEIYNLDMRGNRVAPMFFGPKKVYLIGGVNKIVSDLEMARKRVREITAVKNVHRLGMRALPCYEDGKCHYCRTPKSICAVEVVIYTSYIPKRIEVLLINDFLGF